MPKMKGHKGLRKRVKVSATGKIVYKKPNAGHLMSWKTGDHCRSLRRPSVLDSPVLAKRIREALGEN